MSNSTRDLDTAVYKRERYESEAAIGRALYKSKIPREELFITTKLWNNDHDPKDVGPALERSLQHLALDYVDLFLMHWPCPFAQGRDRFPLDERGRIIPGTTDFVNVCKCNLAQLSAF